ncbi:TetR/AcrR family transcriptional regulator [Mumia sp. DW29H23]|uniref:TetR/AcrR family transcriptional regulator n=1 Tax=Mumia sp. DW29H23 TaxID=3421241 RepID=UPI003D69C606
MRKGAVVGRSSKAQSEINRAHLVDLAGTLFAERGYDAVSLDDVAHEAGLTRGAVYHHFGSKRGLFVAAVGRAHETVAARVEAAASAEVDLWDGLVAGCHAFLDAAADPSVRRLVLIDGPRVLGWQEWRSLDAATSRQLLATGLRALEDRGDVARGSADALATLLSGAMNDAALEVAEPGSATREELHAALDRILGCLRPPPAAHGSKR